MGLPSVFYLIKSDVGRISFSNKDRSYKVMRAVFFLTLILPEQNVPIMKRTLLYFGIALLAVACANDDGESCSVPVATEKNATPFTNGCGMAVSKSGRIAITVYNGGYGQPGAVHVYKDYDALLIDDRQTSLVVTAPEAVAFDSQENLYVAETEAVAGVKVYQSNDYYFVLNRTIQIGFNNPRGLAIDDQDRLYVCDDGNGRVVLFNNPLTSDEHGIAQGFGGGIKGIAVKGDRLYVTNYGLNRVSQFRITPGDEMAVVGTGEATVEKATDISLSSNKIVVTSFDTGKMTLFSDCDFSNENKKEFSLGSCFGTAFLKGGKLLGAFYNEDVIKEIAVK